MKYLNFDFIKNNKIFTLVFLVKSGRRYETKSEYQYSHILEHMLTLKGSINFPSVLIANQVIEKFGSIVFASTNLERTRFVLQGNIDYLNNNLEVFLDNIFNPLFAPDVFEKEKQIIIQENKIRNKNKENVLIDKIMSLIFGENEIFSKEKEKLILKTKLKDIKNYYQKHYNPLKYTFFYSSSSQKNKKEVELFLNKYLNPKNLSFKKQKLDLPRKINLNFKNQFIFEKNNTDVYSIFIYFLLPNISLKEAICLDLIANFLSLGQSSLFYQKLRFEKSLVYGISAFSNHKSDCSLFVIQTKTFNPKEVIKIIFNEIQNLKINKDIFKDLKIQAQNLILRSFLNPINRISFLEYLWLKNERNLSVDLYFKILNKININDINLLLKKINNSKTIIGLTGPKEINI
ncbi:MAG: M16 family metallopeptidase [Minisyncoccia bacterium]